MPSLFLERRQCCCVDERFAATSSSAGRPHDPLPTLSGVEGAKYVDSLFEWRSVSSSSSSSSLVDAFPLSFAAALDLRSFAGRCCTDSADSRRPRKIGYSFGAEASALEELARTLSLIGSSGRRLSAMAETIDAAEFVAERSQRDMCGGRGGWTNAKLGH